MAKSKLKKKFAAKAGKKSFGSNNPSLYRAANLRAGNVPIFVPTPNDAKNDVTSYTHKRLMAIGRFIFSNVPYAKGATKEIANYAIGSGWAPIFCGKNADWGTKAEELVSGWMRVCEMRGLTFAKVLNLAVVSVLRDGDILIILTENETGYPQIQTVAAHRIGSRDAEEWNGYKVQNGIAYNAFGRAVAVCVLGDDEKTDKWIIAKDHILIKAPDWIDQLRGISGFASGIPDIADVDTLTKLEKAAAIRFAQETIIEKREDDTSDEDEFLEETGPNGAEVTVSTIESDEIRTRVYRAGSGSDVKAFEQSRPDPNLLEFRRELIRGFFSGINWSIELSYDPAGLRGANNRMIIAKAARTVEDWQITLGLVAYRIVGWVIARFMKMGLLPWDDEWYKWDFQMPRKLTVDEGREAQQEREDLRSGVTTLAEIYGKRGLKWVAEVDQRLYEMEYTLAQALNKTKYPNLSALLQKIGAQWVVAGQLAQNIPSAPGGQPAKAPSDDGDKAKKEEDKNEEDI